MVSNNLKSSEQKEHEKLLTTFILFFNHFNNFFANEKVDEIVNQEFPHQYSLLPLLVKARMYYDKQ